ncbi:MAG TPA: DUF4347 domain-containing protein, partial [Gemmataceae bacterium]|nr:DUF4347 domain-containing protein [Gemmataceae bacterium]
MAHFFQKPQTPGKWSGEANTLTITLGEVAQVVLDGGGPSGKEQLTIVMNSDSSPFPDTVEQRPAAGQRFFRITPKVVGETWLTAKIPGTTVDFAKPLILIVLPRKESSLGPEDIILYSEKKDTGFIEHLYDKAQNGATEREVVAVGSYAEFIGFLKRYRDAGRRIGKIEFVTHGSPGLIAFGRDYFTIAHIQSLAGQGFNTVFAPNARVFFSGCKVGAEVKGVLFLIEFGRVFLFNGGGSVAASTSDGHGVNGGKVYHVWGETRRIYF